MKSQVAWIFADKAEDQKVYWGRLRHNRSRTYQAEHSQLLKSSFFIIFFWGPRDSTMLPNTLPHEFEWIL